MTPKQREYLEALRDGRAPGTVVRGAGGTRVRRALLTAGLVRYERTAKTMTRSDGSTYLYEFSRVVLTDEGRAAVPA